VTAHGAVRGVNPHVYLGPDPELSMVDADMGAWLDAHPCACLGLCVCDEREETTT
jgi:hypothetical protein